MIKHYISNNNKSRYFLNVGNIDILCVEICLAYVLRFLLVGPQSE